MIILAPMQSDATLGVTAATAFSGIGAPELAMPGWRWRWHAEIEPRPAGILAAHHPGSCNLGDVLAGDFLARAAHLGPLQVLVGGPPCQAFSIAGKRGGLDDPRGALSLRWVELIHAIEPDFTVTENVPGWLSHERNAFGCFLGALAGADAPLQPPPGRGWPCAGMVAGPLQRACWRVLDAQYFGLAQRRERVFVVSSSRAWADPAEILFEPARLRRDPPARGQAGQDVARPLASCPRGGSGYHNDPECLYGDRAAPLDTDGWTQAVAFSCKDHGADAGELAPTLRAMGHDASHANAGGQLAVAMNLRGREGGAMPEMGGDLASIRASNGGSGRSYVVSAAVRRLTPRECERLQGFFDDYTLVPEGLADGPRYRAIGNSMAVPVLRWILARIERQLLDRKP
jgi:DNA (cytosine-5)-methyltransferase 1